MEVVLGIDNLIFISILSNKLPEEQRQKAHRVGIGLALVMRFALLSMIAWIVGLTAPVFYLDLTGTIGAHGEPSFETAFSWRDLILVWKATKEIHHTIDPVPSDSAVLDKKQVAGMNCAAIFQSIMLDMVFSIDSILTAVGMTEHVAIVYIAVIVTVLIPDGFGVHVPKRGISTPPWPFRRWSRRSTSSLESRRRGRARWAIAEACSKNARKCAFWGRAERRILKHIERSVVNG